MFATGAKKSAIPIPEMMNGTTSSEYGVVGVETERDPARAPIACSVSPIADERLAADPVRQRARDRRDEDRHRSSTAGSRRPD